ncbi:transposase family protein, partial [Streptomyces sp. NPDC007355]|uniref:transposase family protein n=1 Tax=Streptomyces sp. NPDC007355 TaxID=3364778 RepID=UPI00367BA108
MWALGLYKSVVLVLFLLRQNLVQAAAAELFGVSQATVSRRWTALLPVVSAYGLFTCTPTGGGEGPGQARSRSRRGFGRPCRAGRRDFGAHL